MMTPMVKINPDNYNNLKKVSAVDCFHIRSISELRFVKYIGKVVHEGFGQIKEGLADYFQSTFNF